MAVKVDIVKALRVTADNLKTNILAGYNSTTSNQLDVIYKDLSEGSKAGITVQNSILKIVDAGSDRDIALGKITTPNVDRVEAHYRVQVSRYELGKAEVTVAGARIFDGSGNYTVGDSTLTGQNVFIQTRTGLDTYTLNTAQLDNEGWIDIHRLIVRTKDGFIDTLTVGQAVSQYQFYIYPDGIAHEYTDELVEQMMGDWVDEHWMHVVTEALRMHVDFVQPDNTIAWGKVDTFIDLGQSYLVINETKYTFPGYTNAEFMTTPEYATIADVESRVQAILNVNQGPQGPQGNAGANGMTINYNNGKLIVGGEYSNSLYQGTGNASSLVLPNGSEIGLGGSTTYQQFISDNYHSIDTDTVSFLTEKSKIIMPDLDSNELYSSNTYKRYSYLLKNNDGTYTFYSGTPAPSLNAYTIWFTYLREYNNAVIWSGESDNVTLRNNNFSEDKLAYLEAMCTYLYQVYNKPIIYQYDGDASYKAQIFFIPSQFGIDKTNKIIDWAAFVEYVRSESRTIESCFITGLETQPTYLQPVNPADTTPLFFEHYDSNKLIDACFVRSENQWNSGAIYVTAYNRLLRELADTTSEFKVIRLSDVGNTPDYQKYFIVDETEMRFKLPVVGSLGAPAAGNYLYYKLVNSVTDINMMNVAEISTALAHKMDNVNIVSTWMSEIASRPSGIDGKKILYVTDYYTDPTNPNRWYRIWSDGKIEQGGTFTVPNVSANWSPVTSTTGFTINLLVPYTSPDYAKMIGQCGITAGANGTGILFSEVTLNSFGIHYYNSAAIQGTWMTWGY